MTLKYDDVDRMVQAIMTGKFKHTQEIFEDCNAFEEFRNVRGETMYRACFDTATGGVYGDSGEGEVRMKGYVITYDYQRDVDGSFDSFDLSFSKIMKNGDEEDLYIDFPDEDEGDEEDFITDEDDEAIEELKEVISEKLLPAPKSVDDHDVVTDADDIVDADDMTFVEEDNEGEAKYKGHTYYFVEEIEAEEFGDDDDYDDDDDDDYDDEDFTYTYAVRDDVKPELNGVYPQMVMLKVDSDGNVVELRDCDEKWNGVEQWRE